MSLIRKISRNRFWLPMLLVILIAINWFASEWHSRIDLTNEKRFTLSTATRDLLKAIDEPLEIQVFLKGDYPSGFRKLSASASDLLQEFREIAGPQLRYSFISPDEEAFESGITWSDTLSASGMFPINLTSQLKEGQQQQFVYPYALVHYKGQIMPVTLYKGKSPLISHQELNSAEAMLEYNFANAIAKTGRTTKPIIGYTTGNGEPMDFQVYDLVENVLNVEYNLSTFNINSHSVIPAEFKVLVIVKPTVAFSQEAKLKIDQYVMNGGKLLMFLDRLEAEMDSLQIKNEVIAYDRGLDLNDMLFRYGARVNADLVMDLQCDYLPFDVSGSGQFELLPWNYFPVLESSSNHPINKNLGFVSSRFVNSIDTVEAVGIRKTILLNSSSNSRTIATPALISGNENVNAPEHEKFSKSKIPVAVLLEGKFRSLYANRLSRSMNDTLLKYNSVFQPESSETKVIIVSDGDIVLNSLIKGNEPIPMGMNPYTYGTQREFPFTNADFLRNSLEYLIDEYNLSEAKGKDYAVRLLDTKKVTEEKFKWQMINILLPVIAVVLFAVAFQFIRKRRYAVKIKK